MALPADRVSFRGAFRRRRLDRSEDLLKGMGS